MTDKQIFDGGDRRVVWWAFLPEMKGDGNSSIAESLVNGDHILSLESVLTSESNALLTVPMERRGDLN
jgi:hypothetical protein